jgi:hypothetical protein
VRVELRHQDDGEREEQAVGPSAFRQRAHRPAHERRQQARREREPDDLRALVIHEREGRHGERERGQVLELVMAVAFPVERLGAECAVRRRAVHLEVGHRAFDSRAIQNRGDDNEQQRPEERPESCEHDGPIV